MFEIDLTKFKKYDRPGPRYTSYPTAPQFNENLKQNSFLMKL
jgi:oxygen-independent coproporphyrinogen III oxidase